MAREDSILCTFSRFAFPISWSLSSVTCCVCQHMGINERRCMCSHHINNAGWVWKKKLWYTNRLTSHKWATATSYAQYQQNLPPSSYSGDAKGLGDLSNPPCSPSIGRSIVGGRVLIRLSVVSERRICLHFFRLTVCQTSIVRLNIVVYLEGCVVR